MPDKLKHAGFVLLLLLAVVPVWLKQPLGALSFKLPPAVPLDKRGAVFKAGFACEDCLAPSVHGANVIEKRDGGLLATWFGGSREGSRDVVIWGADFDPVAKTWSNPRKIIGPEATRQALGRYIKTVGNSVLVHGSDKQLRLYYVSVSFGGWAGSALNVMQSGDEGRSWSAPQRLVTSPFFNVSTLNKCSAVEYEDGSIGLPVYHELFGKFAELLHVDASGKIVDKQRITHGRHSIQPLILPLDQRRALALMRDTVAQPGRVLLSHTSDAGQGWSPDERLELPNPDSAIAGLRRPDGSLLLVLNDVEVGRNSLALAVSRDNGTSWKVVRHFEQSASAEEYSYPYLIRADDGTMHLVYTWNRKRIRYVMFNDQWVDGGDK